MILYAKLPHKAVGAYREISIGQRVSPNTRISDLKHMNIMKPDWKVKVYDR